MASCMLVDHRCQWLPSILSVKMVQMHCHRTANHLSVLTHVGIESIDSFASVTTSNTRKFEAFHSHPFPDPTRNTTYKVYTFWISGMAANNSILYHEDSDHEPGG